MAEEINSRTSHPWNAVVYVSVTYIDLQSGQAASVFDPDVGRLVSGTHASGVVVGRNDVLTAAHVVMMPAWLDQARYGIKVQVHPGADNSPFSAPFGSYAAASWSSRDIVVSSGSITAEQSQFDFALLNFTEPFGDKLGWMHLDSASRFSGTANETGYPGSGPGMMNATVTYTNDWRYYLYHTSEPLGKGASGGPLWYSNAEGSFVLGVLSSEDSATSNYASLAAPGVIEWLVPLMAANDSLIASTAGNDIMLLLPWAMATADTAIWASAKTTARDDTISAASANLPVVRIEGGPGSDVLRLTGGGPVNLVHIASVEVLDLRETRVANSVINMGVNFTTVYLGPDGDAVTITAAAATVTGGPGNDRITVGPGNMAIDGAGGIDTVLLPLARSEYQLATGTTTPPAGRSGSHYSFTGVERLQFADVKLALDLYGAAGDTARMIGAALGPQYLENTAYVGAGLTAFDSGLDATQVAELVLDSRVFQQLAGSRTSVDVVTHLYRNVIGTAPAAVDLDYYVGLLDGGMSQADLLLLAGNSDLNAQRIDLAGLMRTGIEFS